VTEIRGLVVSPDDFFDADVECWVTGLVVSNTLSRPGDGHGENDTDLGICDNSEYLVVRLGEHHPLDEREYMYHFECVELARSSDGAVVQITADWNYRDECDLREAAPRLAGDG